MKTMMTTTTTGKKGAEQPIWILVAVLLALIVGVMMYQFLQKGQQGKTFEAMLGEVDKGTALLKIDSMCATWKNFNWATEPSDLGTVSVDYAGSAELLNKAEWEAHETLTVCDCAVYLHVDKKAITRSDVYAAAPDPNTCHANMLAKYPA